MRKGTRSSVGVRGTVRVGTVTVGEGDEHEDEGGARTRMGAMVRTRMT
jgi:hypothetical protein